MERVCTRASPRLPSPAPRPIPCLHSAMTPPGPPSPATIGTGTQAPSPYRPRLQLLLSCLPWQEMLASADHALLAVTDHVDMQAGLLPPYRQKQLGNAALWEPRLHRDHKDRAGPRESVRGCLLQPQLDCAISKTRRLFCSTCASALNCPHLHLLAPLAGHTAVPTMPHQGYSLGPESTQMLDNGASEFQVGLSPLPSPALEPGEGPPRLLIHRLHLELEGF